MFVPLYQQLILVKFNVPESFSLSPFLSLVLCIFAFINFQLDVDPRHFLLYTFRSEVLHKSALPWTTFTDSMRILWHKFHLAIGSIGSQPIWNIPTPAAMLSYYCSCHLPWLRPPPPACPNMAMVCITSRQFLARACRRVSYNLFMCFSRKKKTKTDRRRNWCWCCYL